MTEGSTFTMSNWTLEHNTYLSCLIDDVTGTEEMFKVRTDSCKIVDSLSSIRGNDNTYFTGSKAEGLDLAGSDEDFMMDINYQLDIEVSESMQHLIQSHCSQKFLVLTDNAPPAFVFLKHVSQTQNQHLPRKLEKCLDGTYLSSHRWMTVRSPSEFDPPLTIRYRTQGPSVETWDEYEDTSASGTDNVMSFRCRFWPASASEWIGRTRHYGWPSSRDREKIVTFGCHLVPIGHPKSETRTIEWRLSFSIAERSLVWSFNHTQIQCYAIMKLILKEFVKTKCTEEHKDVLCSYFIKTFLFWQLETTDPLFWQHSNLRGCLMHLFKEFHKCIQTGILRHYFVPRFNLLEIKLSRDAQIELLQIFNVIIQTDLGILGQCASLTEVWSRFCQSFDVSTITPYIYEITKHHMTYNDKFLMAKLNQYNSKASTKFPDYKASINAIQHLVDEGDTRTFLPLLTIRELYLWVTIETISCSLHGNKSKYKGMQALNQHIYGINTVSSNLWLATFLVQQNDYCRALQKINNTLSSIPPYALYNGLNRYSSKGQFGAISLTEQMYEDIYLGHDVDVLTKAKGAWLLDINVFRPQYWHVPRAIQIELECSDPKYAVRVSPYTYAYYLMFLCYHELNQYDDRNWALSHLIRSVCDSGRVSPTLHHSLNITGHCFLLVGNVSLARIFFLKSANFMHRMKEAFDKYNSAYLYLSLM